MSALIDVSITKETRRETSTSHFKHQPTRGNDVKPKTGLTKSYTGSPFSTASAFPLSLSSLPLVQLAFPISHCLPGPREL